MRCNLINKTLGFFFSELEAWLIENINLIVNFLLLFSSEPRRRILINLKNSFLTVLYQPRFLLDSGPGRSLARVGGPSVCQVNLRSSLTSPGTGGAENDLRLTLHTLGPPTFPKVEGEVFMVGPWENVYETLDGGRGRCREML